MSDLLQAIKTPFALAGFTAFCLGMLALVIALFLPGRRAYKTIKMAAVLIAFSTIVTAMIVYEAMHQIENNRLYASAHAVYVVNATIKGSIQTAQLSDPFTFQVSSGQVNVGCNDTRQTNAQWFVPSGATEVQANANWENTNNTKSLAQAVNIAPTAVTASGQLSGLDTNFFGNCSGGGHGELVLRGTYRLMQEETRGQQVLKTVDDKLNKGQAFVIAIPINPKTTPEACDVTIQEGTRKETVHWDLKVDADKAISISNKVATHSGNEIPFEASVAGDRITIRIL